MKNNKLNILRLSLVALITLLAAACGTVQIALQEPTPVTNDVPEASEDSSELDPTPAPPAGVSMAKEAALIRLGDEFGGSASLQDQNWQSAFITEGNLSGSGDYRFVSGSWTMTISYPVVAPEQAIYHVTVTNPSQGFEWECSVNSSGEIIEPEDHSHQVRVTGWLGRVVSLAPEAQFDDYLVLSPDGTGEFGLTGATAEIEAEIIELRDKTAPGHLAHFWGNLDCQVPDYNGCQLVVDRLRYGASATDLEPVEGWVGTLSTSTFNGGKSYVFILQGDYPVWHSLHSTDPEVLAEVERLVNTGAILQVWGTFNTGVPDVNGTRIQVERLEIIGQAADLFPGWARYDNGNYGFSFRYPVDWQLETAQREIGSAAGGPQQIILRAPDHQLVIQVKKEGEAVFLGPGGLAAGDIQDHGTTSFLGQEVHVQALIFKGLTKSVFFGHQIYGLEFYIQLDADFSSGLDYESLLISKGAEAQFEQILASFEVYDSQ